MQRKLEPTACDYRIPYVTNIAHYDLVLWLILYHSTSPQSLALGLFITSFETTKMQFVNLSTRALAGHFRARSHPSGLLCTASP